MLKRFRKYLAELREKERASTIVYQGQKDARIGNRQAWIEYHRVKG